MEEARNQVAVKRGPIVYCLESMDIADGKNIDDVLLNANAELKPVPMMIGSHRFVALEGDAQLADETSWKDKLYREVGKTAGKVHIKLIPYYAWGNRQKCDMTIWMPLTR